MISYHIRTEPIDDNLTENNRLEAKTVILRLLRPQLLANM